MFEQLRVLSEIASSKRFKKRRVFTRVLNTHIQDRLSENIAETHSPCFREVNCSSSNTVYIVSEIFKRVNTSWTIKSIQVFQHKESEKVRWKSGKFKRILVHFGEPLSYTVGRNCVGVLKSGCMLVSGSGAIVCDSVSREQSVEVLITFK